MSIIDGKKSLLKSSGKVFVLDGVTDELKDITVDIGNVDLVTVEEYLEFGMDGLEGIKNEHLMSIEAPIEVLYWTDEIEEGAPNPNINFKVTPYNVLTSMDEPKLLIHSERATPIANSQSVPHRQMIKPNEDIRLGMLESINSIDLTANELDGGKVRIVFSVDSGEKWQTYNTITQDFAEVNVNDLDYVEQRGMTIDTFNTVGAKWNDVVTDDKIRFGYYVEIDEVTDTANIDKLAIDMDLTGRWKEAHHPTEYDYEYDNKNIFFTFKLSGSYKVNYT